MADAALHGGVQRAEWEERLLSDRTTQVYKRFFTGAGLAAELGGGRVLHEGRWFVVVRA